MLNNTQVEEIAMLAAKNAKRFHELKGKDRRSVWGEAYKEAVEHADEICVHSERGEFPTDLMVAKAPNETPEELAYRKAIYESITVPYWFRAESSLNRIFSEQNYKIEWPADNEAAKSYFTEQFPVYGNIISFFQSVVKSKKVRDPNAVLALDFNLPLKQAASGEMVVDQSKEIKPYASIYESEHVLMYEIGDFCLLHNDEENTAVEYGGNKKAPMGMVMYLYDDTYIYRISQTGKFIDFTFTVEQYYKHNLGYVPAWKLRGIPCEVEGGNPVYESYFAPALPHLNKAVKLDNTLDLSIGKVAYPIRVYYEQACTNSECNNGKVYSAEGGAKACSVCNGTGKLKFSPARDYVHQVPGRLDDADNQPQFPGLTYVSPDSNILEFSKQKIKDDIETAFTFINIDVSLKGDNTGEQSATKAKIDRDEQFTFMLTISNELFALLSDFINAAYSIRWGSSHENKAIKVSPPKTFELLTSQELTSELSEGKKSGIPNIALLELNKEYIQQRFPQNGVASRIATIVNYCDPYSIKSSEEIALLKGQGIIQLWQAILHEEIINYIQEEQLNDSEFINKDLPEIKTTIEAKAKARADESKVNANTLMNQLANGG